MNKAGVFIKKYWITFCIFSGLMLLHVYVAGNKLVSLYLFPSADTIKQAFISGHGMMAGNMLASFKLLIPSVTVLLPITLFLGAIIGMGTRVREVLYPIIYASSVISSILLSPFVLLVAPSLFSASVFLIVYNITWAALFAIITGVVTIDKQYLNKAATLELRRFKRLIKIILSAASPSTLVGFVNSLRSSFAMLVFTEMYGAGQGMGYLVKKYAELGIFASTWAGFVFMVIILVIVMQIFELLRRHLLRWTMDQRSSAESQRWLGRRLEKIRPT